MPVNLPQPIDGPDLLRFAITLPNPEAATTRDTPLPVFAAAPVLNRGAAIEDGPVTQIGIPAVGDPSGAATLPRVIVPTPLPPGVTYHKGKGSFVLDPTHPAYQHLGVGETETVTVEYRLILDDSASVPASVPWTIDGRNDAPTAAADRFDALDEVGQTILPVRFNDRDIDGDVLQVVRWTSPLEGSIRMDSKGNLVFDPGSSFQALSRGETATVAFDYTIQDGNGGADTATVTLQVRGEGTFTAPRQISSDSDVLGFNRQSVSLTVDGPNATTTATANLDLTIGLGPVLQLQMNILYLTDISGSTLEAFQGEQVGDFNGDDRANTILNAEIASLVAVTEKVRAIGFSPDDVTVTVIPFNASADPTDVRDEPPSSVNAATFTIGQAGGEAIASYLRGLNAGGETNFENALRAANNRLLSLDQGNEANFLYFLSDGRGRVPSMGRSRHSTNAMERRSLPSVSAATRGSPSSIGLTTQTEPLFSQPPTR